MQPAKTAGSYCSWPNVPISLIYYLNATASNSGFVVISHQFIVNSLFFSLIQDIVEIIHECFVSTWLLTVMVFKCLKHKGNITKDSTEVI